MEEREQDRALTPRSRQAIENGSGTIPAILYDGKRGEGMSAKDFKETLWQARKDAHQVHHRIADFILHADTRDHPPKLASLIKKYRKMMAEAEVMELEGQ